MHECRSLGSVLSNLSTATRGNRAGSEKAKFRRNLALPRGDIYKRSTQLECEYRCAVGGKREFDVVIASVALTLYRGQRLRNLSGISAEAFLVGV